VLLSSSNEELAPAICHHETDAEEVVDRFEAADGNVALLKKGISGLEFNILQGYVANRPCIARLHSRQLAVDLEALWLGSRSFNN